MSANETATAAAAGAGAAAPAPAATTTTTTAQDTAPASSPADGSRVHVGNLSYKVREEELREHLKSAGEIISVLLPMRFKDRHKGFAFVTFKDAETAENAVKTQNDTELDGRKITLEVARSKEENNARRAARPKKEKAPKADNADASKEDKAASKDKPSKDAAAGEGEKAAAAADKDVAPKKKAAKKRQPRRRREDGEDTAVDEDAAAKDGDDKAAGPNGSKKTGPRPTPPKRLALTDEQSKNTVFVANLPYKVDDAQLKTLFEDAGFKTDSAHVIMGPRRIRNRRPFVGSKGFGFVVLLNSEDQAAAVAKLNGLEVDGRAITAKIAQEMKPIEQTQAAQADGEGKDAKDVKDEVKTEETNAGVNGTAAADETKA